MLHVHSGILGILCKKVANTIVHQYRCIDDSKTIRSLTDSKKGYKNLLKVYEKFTRSIKRA